MLNENGGPWGGGSGGEGGSGNNDDGLGPRNPWAQPPRKKAAGKAGFGPSAFDELLRRGKTRFGGNLPGDARQIWLIGIAAFLLLWIFGTSLHRINPGERGVITRLGSYAGTLPPGLRFTLPAPIDHLTKVNVEDIRVQDIGSAKGNDQNLVLTGDENIIDLAYSVRWNIRDPELYLFELAEPDETVKEVAESAMRAEIAHVSLDDAIGPQRSQIEDRVQRRMQQVLDHYRSGILIQGVAIKQADPPAAVNEAFKEVSAAQQAAQSYLNSAKAYAQQVGSVAEGEASAFDKVYAQYKLAPDVTRKRMYYETMEKVLAKNNKTIIAAPGVNSYLPLAPITSGNAQK